MKREMTRKLHLGCGLTAPQSWLNVDGSFNAKIAQYPKLRKILGGLRILPRNSLAVPWPTNVFIHDLRRPLPWPVGRFTAVYASHVLEHFFLTEARRLLAECFRVLDSGGVARIVVPDLDAAIKDYHIGRKHPLHDRPTDLNCTPGDDLNIRLLYHGTDPMRGSFFARMYRSASNFHEHKWMYDAPTLIRRMEEAGFKDVRQMGYLESRIPDIGEVEQEMRVLDGGLVVEGVKPRQERVTSA
jgi:SAM-dependent methyltransferase